jgi:hypothetical protein
MPTPPPDKIQYLDLADYLWLAGAALDRAPEAVFDVPTLASPSQPCTHQPPPTAELSSTPIW